MSNDTDLESPRVQVERSKTDDGLRAERARIDKAAADELVHRDRLADELVAGARSRADALLGAARGRADLTPSAGAGAEREAVERARALEDVALRDERGTADARRRLEREARARALVELLPLEREATDRLLLNERARADAVLANRDDFMAMVSHDLRNLLGGIVLNASVLSDEASDSVEGRRTVAGVERIQRYAGRMNRLIADLVDVVSIDAGQLALRPQRCDVAALISEAVDGFAHAATAKGVSIAAAHVEPSTLIAELDRERVEQVLNNIITNALKFTPRGGSISVHGAPKDDAVHVSVMDTGAGIPTTMLSSVFERFWQAKRNDERGLGLGLYISRGIVEAHGGRIWAESVMGQGSAFHFTLPRSNASRSATARAY